VGRLVPDDADLHYWIRVAEQMMRQHGWPLKKVILLILYTGRAEGLFTGAEDEALLEHTLVAHFAAATDDTPSDLTLPEGRGP
jgi:hypothetical protein